MVGQSSLDLAKPGTDAGSGSRDRLSKTRGWTMGSPVGMQKPLSAPSPSNMDWGANALSAPTTPARRVPVVDRSKVDPEVLKAAEGMEAMFLDYMMKVMRETVPKNDMDLESPATNIFRGMLDTEYAEKAAHRGGIGLSDQIIAYLQARSYNLPEGHGVPKKEKP